MKGERCEFHCHSFLSDGELLPMELLRRAQVLGHRAVAITDHVGPSNVERVVAELARDCEVAMEAGFLALPGVEVTHVPPRALGRVVHIARRAGARIVVVHGETPVEPVAAGTNAAAVALPEVDILAHPGFLTLEEAERARETGVLVEISGRRGHSLANGHVARILMEAGALPIVNTDAHASEDLVDQAVARRIALGAGMPEKLVEEATVVSPALLLKRAGLI